MWQFGPDPTMSIDTYYYYQWLSKGEDEPDVLASEGTDSAAFNPMKPSDSSILDRFRSLWSLIALITLTALTVVAILIVGTHVAA